MTKCECPATPEKVQFNHYGAVEPGSMYEYNPACPTHGSFDELASTLEWLYGRKPDTDQPDEGSWWNPEGFVIWNEAQGVIMHDGKGTMTILSPDDAVDLARSLLASAAKERAERDQVQSDS